MTDALLGLAAALTVAMAFSLYRVLRGPTIFDRLAGLGLIGTKTIVLLLVLGFVTGRLELFVDISIAYGLINLIGSLAMAKYFETKPHPDFS